MDLPKFNVVADLITYENFIEMYSIENKCEMYFHLKIERERASLILRNAGQSSAPRVNFSKSKLACNRVR